MKLNNRKSLEQQIRHMDDTPYTPTPEHMEEIKRRAFQQYMARQSQPQQQSAPQRSGKKRGVLRRAAIIAAAAVCLMVLSFLYSVLAPVTVSSANNVVRRAVIWINDQLHLGITFPEPIDTDPHKAEITGYTVFSTLEEAAQRVDLPVVYLKDSGDLTLSSISANTSLYEKTSLSVVYSNSTDSIIIHVYNHKNSSTVSFSSANYRTISSNAGDVFVCESEDGANAYLFYDDYSIRISTSLELSTFCSLLQSLTLFN